MGYPSWVAPTLITGKTLIEMGYKPGPWFPAAIAAANAAAARGDDVRAAVDAVAPPRVESIGLRAHGDLAHHLNIRAEDADEAENVAAVERHMRELMRVPTIVAGAVMPDACPAGAAPGTIPVGGVIAAKDAIHPGMHSADICCSMADHDVRRCRADRHCSTPGCRPAISAAADGRTARSCVRPTRS